MRSLEKIAFFCLAACAGLSAFGGGLGTTMLPGSVSNFELPSFNEKSGAKEWELFGESAKFVSDERIDAKKIKLNIFEAGEPPKISAVLVSPEATVNPQTKIVDGPSDINVDGDGFDLAGKKWRWNGDKKFMEIFSGVVINFRASPMKGANPETPEKSKITGAYASLSHGGADNIFYIKGDVRVDSPDMRISCDSLNVDAVKGGGKNAAKSILAEGDVKMLHDGKEAVAQRASIDPRKGLAVLTGNPLVSDIASKASLTGDIIVIDRPAQRMNALSAEKPKLRPAAVFYHDDKNGKSQKIRVSADKIEMRTLDGKNVFAFSGGVKVDAEDFKAKCDSIYAVAAASGGKSAVEFIKGVGSVVLSNESGTARSKEMQILPDKSEIWLTGGATLTDDSAGMRLESPVIIMMRQQNRGIAVSDAKDKNSFVKVFISQAPDIAAQTGRAHKGRAEPAVISARRLNFLRDGKDLLFTFTDDVRIKSSDTDASCSQMDIEAVSAKGGGSAVIKKITARRGVEIMQKEYTAKSELAVIYPRLKTAPDGDAKQPHRFVELSVSPDNPNVRPSVILPAIGNLGMEESAIAKKSKQEPTIITSDKQWLTSSAAADRYFFEGNVDISGTDMKGGCGKIEVVMKSPKPDAKREISQIAMSDSVKLSQGLKDVSCGRADYYAAEEMLVLQDSPVVVNREDNTRASGYRIVYDKGSRRISVESQGAPPRGPQPAITAPSTPAESEIDDDGEAPKRPTITIQTRRR